MPSPAPSELALPLWGQITAALAFVAGAFGVVRNAWKATPKSEPQNDAVVISGAFADAQPIRELVQAVKALTEVARESSEATTRFDRNQADRSRDLIGAMDDMKREQRSSTDELQAIRDVVSRGVRIMPGAPDPPRS